MQSTQQHIVLPPLLVPPLLRFQERLEEGIFGMLDGALLAIRDARLRSMPRPGPVGFGRCQNCGADGCHVTFLEDMDAVAEENPCGPTMSRYCTHCRTRG